MILTRPLKVRSKCCTHNPRKKKIMLKEKRMRLCPFDRRPERSGLRREPQLTSLGLLRGGFSMCVWAGRLPPRGGRLPSCISCMEMPTCAAQDRSSGAQTLALCFLVSDFRMIKARCSAIPREPQASQECVGSTMVASGRNLTRASCQGAPPACPPCAQLTAEL